MLGEHTRSRPESSATSSTYPQTFPPSGHDALASAATGLYRSPGQAFLHLRYLPRKAPHPPGENSGSEFRRLLATLGPVLENLLHDDASFGGLCIRAPDDDRAPTRSGRGNDRNQGESGVATGT